VSRQIRRLRPDRVVAQSPERVWDRLGASHPDHLAAGEAVVCAVYPDARNPFAHPELLEEGLEPFSVPELWLMAAPETSHAVDVTDTFDRKIAALCRHASQIGDPAEIEARVRGWLADNARRAGLPAGRLAEAFRLVHIF
jgi:LmbE family N-acetylglucosaminyl deacetylase